MGRKRKCGSCGTAASAVAAAVLLVSVLGVAKGGQSDAGYGTKSSRGAVISDCSLCKQPMIGESSTTTIITEADCFATVDAAYGELATPAKLRLLEEVGLSCDDDVVGFGLQACVDQIEEKVGQLPSAAQLLLLLPACESGLLDSPKEVARKQQQREQQGQRGPKGTERDATDGGGTSFAGCGACSNASVSACPQTLASAVQRLPQRKRFRVLEKVLPFDVCEGSGGSETGACLQTMDSLFGVLLQDSDSLKSALLTVCKQGMLNVASDGAAVVEKGPTDSDLDHPEYIGLTDEQRKQLQQRNEVVRTIAEHHKQKLSAVREKCSLCSSSARRQKNCFSYVKDAVSRLGPISRFEFVMRYFPETTCSDQTTMERCLDVFDKMLLYADESKVDYHLLRGCAEGAVSLDEPHSASAVGDPGGLGDGRDGPYEAHGSTLHAPGNDAEAVRAADSDWEGALRQHAAAVAKNKRGAVSTGSSDATSRTPTKDINALSATQTSAVCPACSDGSAEGGEVSDKECLVVLDSAVETLSDKDLLVLLTAALPLLGGRGSANEKQQEQQHSHRQRQQHSCGSLTDKQCLSFLKTLLAQALNDKTRLSRLRTACAETLLTASPSVSSSSVAAFFLASKTDRDAVDVTGMPTEGTVVDERRSRNMPPTLRFTPNMKKTREARAQAKTKQLSSSSSSARATLTQLSSTNSAPAPGGGRGEGGSGDDDGGMPMPWALLTVIGVVATSMGAVVGRMLETRRHHHHRYETLK